VVAAASAVVAAAVATARPWVVVATVAAEAEAEATAHPHLTWAAEGMSISSENMSMSLTTRQLSRRLPSSRPGLQPVLSSSRSACRDLFDIQSLCAVLGDQSPSKVRQCTHDSTLRHPLVAEVGT
jgi:hypothetical protein